MSIAAKIIAKIVCRISMVGPDRQNPTPRQIKLHIAKTRTILPKCGVSMTAITPETSTKTKRTCIKIPPTPKWSKEIHNKSLKENDGQQDAQADITPPQFFHENVHDLSRLSVVAVISISLLASKIREGFGG